jgi:Flp pilus assembly pilin Flp
MRNLTAIKAFVYSDDGATAAEYAVMLAAIFLALIVGANLFGDGVELWWTRNKTEIDAI